MPEVATPRALARLAWSVATLLVALGAVAGVARAVFIDDLVARIEPARGAAMRELGVRDPYAARRAAEVASFDARFARHRGATLAHVLPGALFLVLAMLQLSARVRSRRPRLHRWTGRLAILAGVASASAGLWFGLAMPHAGAAEAVPVATFGTLFLLALANGYRAIRARDRARHREWMVRAFALAAGIATVRLVALPLDLLLTPPGYAPRTIFVISLWLGWVATLAMAELWLARTRPTVQSAASMGGRRDVSALLSPAVVPTRE